MVAGALLFSVAVWAAKIRVGGCLFQAVGLCDVVSPLGFCSGTGFGLILAVAFGGWIHNWDHLTNCHGNIIRPAAIASVQKVPLKPFTLSKSGALAENLSEISRK